MLRFRFIHANLMETTPATTTEAPPAGEATLSKLQDAKSALKQARESLELAERQVRKAKKAVKVARKENKVSKKKSGKKQA